MIAAIGYHRCTCVLVQIRDAQVGIKLLVLGFSHGKKGLIEVHDSDLAFAGHSPERRYCSSRIEIGGQITF